MKRHFKLMATFYHPITYQLRSESLQKLVKHPSSGKVVKERNQSINLKVNNRSHIQVPGAVLFLLPVTECVRGENAQQNCANKLLILTIVKLKEYFIEICDLSGFLCMQDCNPRQILLSYCVVKHSIHNVKLYVFS